MSEFTVSLPNTSEDSAQLGGYDRTAMADNSALTNGDLTEGGGVEKTLQPGETKVWTAETDQTCDGARFCMDGTSYINWTLQVVGPSGTAKTVWTGSHTGFGSYAEATHDTQNVQEYRLVGENTDPDFQYATEVCAVEAHLLVLPKHKHNL